MLRGIVVLSATLVLGFGPCAPSYRAEVTASPKSLCPPGQSPWLAISVAEGAIVAELFDSAAPEAVRRVAELVSTGYYDGLTFNYTKPHFEIITAERKAEDQLLIEKELDAVALGLDKITVESVDRAMDIFQFEIFPAFTDSKKQPTTPRMKEWLEEWEQSTKADFLLGVSRQEINEALGYIYKGGYESRPVTKGAVALKPASRTHSTARINIVLSHQPERTGQLVVIGQVVERLDLADEISIRPLDVPPGFRSYDFRPLNPVVIETVRFECRQRSGAGRRDK
jgi:cyclophilin family peptidyl-prolyl cis-trans isomerase